MSPPACWNAGGRAFVLNELSDGDVCLKAVGEVDNVGTFEALVCGRERQRARMKRVLCISNIEFTELGIGKKGPVFGTNDTGRSDN